MNYHELAFPQSLHALAAAKPNDSLYSTTHWNTVTYSRPRNKSSGASSGVSSAPTARVGSLAPRSSRSKSRFIHEVKQDVRFEDLDDCNEDIKACGFPLHLGKLTLQHFRHSFWTLRTRSKSHEFSAEVPKKGIEDETTDNSEEMFWSDEVRYT